MKKKNLFTLLIITLFLTNYSKAQIQLSADDVLAKGIYKNAIDTVPNIQLGTPGGSKTWDFTGLKKHLSSEIIIAPYTDNGMGLDANLVEIEDGDTSSYFKKSSTSLKVVFPDEEMGYINLKVFNFPFTYNSNIKDSSKSYLTMTGDDFGMPLIDSIRMYFNISYESTGDAWGTLKTPSGNYSTLRILSDIKTEFWLEGKIGIGNYTKIPGFEETSNTTEYKWFANGKGYPLASYDVENNEFTYYESGILSSKNIVSENEKNIIASNPVGDNFLIKNNGNESCDVKITDINGKAVLSTSLNKGEEIKSDASFLPKGIYIMNVNNLDSNKSYNTKLIK